MILYAYYKQQTYNRFVLFFNYKGKIIKTYVENILGLRNLLLSSNSVMNVKTDNTDYVQEILDLELKIQ
jgi:hypothetical protein